MAHDCIVICNVDCLLYTVSTRPDRRISSDTAHKKCEVEDSAIWFHVRYNYYGIIRGWYRFITDSDAILYVSCGGSVCVDYLLDDGD